MNIDEYRDKYPQFEGIDSETLARNLHQKYYSRVPYERFAKDFGVIEKSPLEKIFGRFADIPAELVKGATLGYVRPEVTPPLEKPGAVHEVAADVAHLAGMALPVGIIAAATGGLGVPAALGTVGTAAVRGAVTGAGYGLLRKPEEGEERLKNMASDALMFSAFVAGGGVISKGLRKIVPEYDAVLSKIQSAPKGTKVELTDVEKALKTRMEVVSSTALGMGAGATRPAGSPEEFFANVAKGGATFGTLHTLLNVKAFLPKTDQLAIDLAKEEYNKGDVQEAANRLSSVVDNLDPQSKESVTIAAANSEFLSGYFKGLTLEERAQRIKGFAAMQAEETAFEAKPKQPVPRQYVAKGEQAILPGIEKPSVKEPEKPEGVKEVERPKSVEGQIELPFPSAEDMRAKAVSEAVSDALKLKEIEAIKAKAPTRADLIEMQKEWAEPVESRPGNEARILALKLSKILSKRSGEKTRFSPEQEDKLLTNMGVPNEKKPWMVVGDALGKRANTINVLLDKDDIKGAGLEVRAGRVELKQIGEIAEKLASEHPNAVRLNEAIKRYTELKNAPKPKLKEKVPEVAPIQPKIEEIPSITDLEKQRVVQSLDNSEKGKITQEELDKRTDLLFEEYSAKLGKTFDEMSKEEQKGFLRSTKLRDLVRRAKIAEK